MFSNHEKLEKHTPANGIDRKEYIALLVDEYSETTNIEAQEQVTANLANFAYDPINWQYLKDAAAVELFLELLSSRNPRLILHGTAALCNIVPDAESRQKIFETDLEPLLALLNHTDHDIIINVLATLIQLKGPNTANQILTSETRSIIDSLTSSENVSIKNLAIVLLESAAS